MPKTLTALVTEVGTEAQGNESKTEEMKARAIPTNTQVSDPLSPFSSPVISSDSQSTSGAVMILHARTSKQSPAWRICASSQSRTCEAAWIETQRTRGSKYTRSKMNTHGAGGWGAAENQGWLPSTAWGITSENRGLGSVLGEKHND
jgi:hypothetical protein